MGVTVNSPTFRLSATRNPGEHNPSDVEILPINSSTEDSMRWIARLVLMSQSMSKPLGRHENDAIQLICKFHTPYYTITFDTTSKIELNRILDSKIQELLTDPQSIPPRPGELIPISGEDSISLLIALCQNAERAWQ